MPSSSAGETSQEVAGTVSESKLIACQMHTLPYWVCSRDAICLGSVHVWAVAAPLSAHSMSFGATLLLHYAVRLNA